MKQQAVAPGSYVRRRPDAPPVRKPGTCSTTKAFAGEVGVIETMYEQSGPMALVFVGGVVDQPRAGTCWGTCLELVDGLEVVHGPMFHNARERARVALAAYGNSKSRAREYLADRLDALALRWVDMFSNLEA